MSRAYYHDMILDLIVSTGVKTAQGRRQPSVTRIHVIDLGVVRLAAVLRHSAASDTN